LGFLGGCTQKNPPRFSGYVPGCLNPGFYNQTKAGCQTAQTYKAP